MWNFVIDFFFLGLVVIIEIRWYINSVGCFKINDMGILNIGIIIVCV